MSLERLEQLFSRALERAPAERDAFLVETCGDDAKLLADARALLASHADAEQKGFLGGALLEGRSASMIGRTIDRYRVVGELGAGGMGMVYLAERADQAFEKQVALKVVRGLDTQARVERFHGERQVLARLEHPNIARLLDGGTTEEGLPYFVLEYVDGERIDRHCLEGALPLRDRIAIFLDVCAAVHFAHQNLVVHRDLKPGNVLVDGHGVVKLLDFGIAKALDPETGAGVDATQARHALFTPAYASPEQVRGEPVSTATDVYALGVMLFELLTGQRPYRIDDSSSIAEIAHAVCEEEPTRPSRAIEQGERRRALEGDLEAIVLKALRKEPERRYASVAAFADDLRAFLEQRPVAARPDSLGYRFGRFARRNRALVAASALAIVALVGGLVVSTALFLRAERQRVAAESTGDFLASLLEKIDPDLAGTRDTDLLEEILDDAAVRIDVELDDSSEVAARLHTVIGNSYNSIGRYDRAAEHLRSALGLLEQGGAVDRALAVPTLGLASVEGNRGDLRASLDLARQAERLFSDDVDGAASARQHQGRMLAQLGDTDEAIAVLQQNVDESGIDRTIVAESLRLAGRAHAIEMRTDDAIALLERARDLTVELYGPDHYQVGKAWGSLGWALFRANRVEDAERAYARSEQIYRAVLPDGHPDIASALTGRAGVLQRQGRYDEAEPLFAEVLERFVASYGPDHIDVGTAYNNLGFLYVEMGRQAEAERNLRAAVDTYGRALGEEHVFVGIVLQNLLKLYGDQGRLGERRDDVERARRILAESFGPDEFRSQLPRAAAAWLAGDLDELLAAEAILAEAGNDQAPRVQRMLAELYERLGRGDEAAAWHERAEAFPEN